MARVSTRAKAYRKGKAEKGYWGTQHLRDILWDISNSHPSWRHPEEDWYRCVQCEMYHLAKQLVAKHGKGEYRNKALDIIDELIERS